MTSDDSFFSRWSRRKQAARTGEALPPEPPAPLPARDPVVAPAAPVPAAAGVAAAAPGTAPAAAPAEPPPTLDDVAQLTPESDFSRFVARDVPSSVRNAAVKKLFADPHFNVMDGLDIYIDDYTQGSPLAEADLARMVGAKFLKLVDDDPPAADGVTAAAPTPPTVAAPVAAPIPDSGPTAAAPDGSPAADLPPPHDDHADLQLQPDHAPERDGVGRGAG